jgi:uncharacterized protein YutE (UPF0331/DUF86 family)
VRRDVVARKVARAEAWLADVELRLGQPREAFLAAAESRDLATFYLFLAMQEIIDLAAHWVADAGWEAPDDAGGAFDVLAARGVIPPAMADRMREMVGLRNRIVHGYTTVTHERLYEEVKDGLPEIRAFLARVADAAGL